MSTVQNKYSINHRLSNKVTSWRLVEIFLLAAILVVVWKNFGDSFTTYINEKREARIEVQAALPKGGPVAKESRNPFLFIPYQWRNYRSEASLLLPDMTPIIGEDPTEGQYPNMEHWLIDTSSQSGRTLLRINTVTANIGDGPLHIVGGKVVGDDEQIVYQRVWRSDDTFSDHEAGRFVYHKYHEHIHFDNYAQYSLRLQDVDGKVIAEGNKIGFCLTDVIPADQALMDASTAYIALPPLECGSREQGINSGFADYYGAKLADQWIDITDVPWGEYQLAIVVDPNNLIMESNEDNNHLSMPLTYSEESVAKRQFTLPQ